MRTANPALSDTTFQGLPRVAQAEAMTLQGTVNKSFFLLLCVLVTAFWTWQKFFVARDPAVVTPWLVGGLIGGLVVGFITIFKKEWAAVTSPLYGLLQGLVIGGISAFAEAQFPGIVLQAVALTFGTLLCLLMAYTSGLIRATENFKLGVVAATGGIFIIYLVTLVLGLFGVNVPYIHQGGWVGIVFSLFVVVVAALNLVLDFDFIENGVAQRAPRYMEWYAAFGLMVTLIWLYLEILRLLAKLRSRD
ncbi:MAG: Bax inhibitor-1/YccA family protein [Deltaproteobacteria bacterium]|nr:Bax inhibitor-1/YccA family protein [Deltaproteobacteria bacterium]